MTPITKKIRSASGSSMPLALLFLLFCLAVGGVVLTAASANAGRTARLKVEQQDYLAVQSAARLMRDELQKLKFTGSYTVTTTETPVLDNQGNPVKGPDGKPTGETKTEITTSAKSGSLGQAQFKELLDKNFANLYIEGIQPPSHDLTITAAGMPDVKATLAVGSDYSITVTLKRKENDSNPMTLRLTQSVASPISIAGNVTTYTTAVTYPDAVITKGGAA